MALAALNSDVLSSETKDNCMSYDTRITFRLSELEKNRIMQQAKAEGITVTHLLRSIVQGYLSWLQKQAR